MSRFLGASALLLILIAGCGGTDTGTPTTELVDQTVEPTTSPPETTAAPEPGVEAPELGGTSWNVTDYSQGPGTITNVWKTEVTISFSEDGTVSGSAGCNDYQGTWQVAGPYDEFESGVPDPGDGQQLILADLSWTEMACEDEAVMEQEAEILDLLQRAGRWVLIRGEFNLRDADGAYLFEADPA